MTNSVGKSSMLKQPWTGVCLFEHANLLWRLFLLKKIRKSGAGELAACVGLCHVYGTCHVIT
jgi:hypothetical protein